MLNQRCPRCSPRNRVVSICITVFAIVLTARPGYNHGRFQIIDTNFSVDSSSFEQLKARQPKHKSRVTKPLCNLSAIRLAFDLSWACQWCQRNPSKCIMVSRVNIWPRLSSTNGDRIIKQLHKNSSRWLVITPNDIKHSLRLLWSREKASTNIKINKQSYFDYEVWNGWLCLEKSRQNTSCIGVKHQNGVRLNVRTMLILLLCIFSWISAWLSA